MLIIGGSGPEKTNVLLNFIREQDNKRLIDKIYLYAKWVKDLNELKWTKVLVFNLKNVKI